MCEWVKLRTQVLVRSREADVFLRMILHRTRSLCCHPIGMLFLAFQVPHPLPMQHNWMLKRTPVPIGGGEEPSVRVQTVDVQEWWERPSTMI